MDLSIPVQRTSRKAKWDHMAKASAKNKTLSTAVALAMAASLSVPFTAYADEDANASQEATQQEETTAANDESATNNEETTTVKATGETEADAKGAIALHSNESTQAVAKVDGKQTQASQRQSRPSMLRAPLPSWVMQQRTSPSLKARPSRST